MSNLRTHFASLRHHKRGLQFDLSASLTMSAHLDEIEAACEAAGILDREPGEPMTGRAISHEFESEQLEAPKDRGFDPATLEEALLTKAARYEDNAMDHPGNSKPRAYCRAKAEALREAVSISRNLPATPSPRDKAGEGQ